MKLAYTGVSIVDYLKSEGKDSSFANRKKIAQQLGIQNYTGTAQQNTQMLNMLRNSATPTPASTSTATAPVNPNLPADYVKSIGTNRDWYDPMSGQSREDYEKTLTANTQRPSIMNRTDPAITALDNISPARKQVNELVQKLIDSFNTQFNPSTDVGFQAAKGQLESAADRAYKNTMAGYLGNQSGNFNSAALQVAAGAQNDLLSQIPLLQAEYEDRFNTRRRQGLSDTMDMVNLLLGLEDRDMAAADKELQGQIETIAQYSNDYQAEINRRMAIDPNDPLIPYLKVARAQKIAAMKEAELDAQEKAVKQAFDMWKELGYATPEIAAALGIPEGTRTSDHANMLADNARADRSLNESKSGKGMGTDFGIALQTMLASGNPMQWLEDNADVFTKDEYKELYGYAKNAGLRPDVLFKSATPEQRAYYESFKDVYLNGISPLGGVSQYKDNPQAALDRLRSDVRSRELLGPLYAVLEEELIRAVEEKKGRDEANKSKSAADRALEAWLNQ